MNMNVSGEIVRRLRLDRGWTQEQLAVLANTSVKTIQRVENTGTCNLETRSALAAVFQIEISQLGGTEKIEQAKHTGDDGLLYYRLLSHGSEVVNVFQGSYWYRFSHEDPKSAEDAEFIAEIVQEIQDWSEIWTDIDAGARVKATFTLTESLKGAEERGFKIFGLRTRTTFKIPTRDGKSEEIPGTVCNIHVAYADSDKIVVLQPEVPR